MIHEQFDLKRWVKNYPLGKMEKGTDVASTLAGPLPVAYVEQIRASVKEAGGDLGRGVPADLCVWKAGDTKRRDVTKIGGIPYWPADESWPTFGQGKHYTFVAQFCFADSKDILPKLPGDILAVLADGADYRHLVLRWFKLGAEVLLPPNMVPAPRWTIYPCHAVLHRTADYPEATGDLFEKYPLPLCMWARVFKSGTKLGGAWELRGELPDAKDLKDAKYRKEIEQAWEQVREGEKAFICQLGSVQATERQPFLNVAASDDLAKSHAEKFLMIADVGGFDFFYKSKTTNYSWWSG